MIWDSPPTTPRQLVVLACAQVSHAKGRRCLTEGARAAIAVLKNRAAKRAREGHSTHSAVASGGSTPQLALPDPMLHANAGSYDPSKRDEHEKEVERNVKSRRPCTSLNGSLPTSGSMNSASQSGIKDLESMVPPTTPPSVIAMQTPASSAGKDRRYMESGFYYRR